MKIQPYDNRDPSDISAVARAEVFRKEDVADERRLGAVFGRRIAADVLVTTVFDGEG